MKRQQTNDNLDALMRSDRRTIVVTLAALLALPALFFMRPYSSQRYVNATVQIAYLDNDHETGQRFIHIQAKLEGGSLIRSGGIPLMPPKQGARIVLRERLGWFGYRSYFWEGPAAKVN